MKKHFEHIFEGQIYTTRFDESANFVAVEVREAIKKTMKVYLIDVTLGKINTEILLDWWDSLVAIAANRIIIQTYSTTSSTPKVIGITVFDSFAGKKVWEIAGFTFLENTKNTLTASKQQVEKLPEWQIFDLAEGSLKNGLFEGVKKEDNKLLFPRKYEENKPYFADLFQFLYRLLKIEAQNCIEYLEFEHKVIFSYYIYHDKQFQNHLLVINRQKEILVHLQLAIAESTSNDTFVMANNTLIVTQNKNHLIGYDC